MRVGCTCLAALLALHVDSARVRACCDGGFVSSTHTLATEAGLEMLRSGGNAVDAAAAVQFVLAVVQPQSTGIGGGCFAVLRNGTTGEVATLDGREEAPELFHGRIFCADADCLLDPACQCTEGAIPAAERRIGGLSAGVPGVVAAMERLVEDYGALTLAETLTPAIRLATDGFVMYQGLHDTILSNANKLARFEASRLLFLDPDDDTRPRVAVGGLFLNPDLASTLQLVAEGGADAFYTGPIAADIAAAAQGAVNNVTGKYGVMAVTDVLGYKAVYREAVRFPYRGREVIGMGMPSSGGASMAQMLSNLEAWDLTSDLPPSSKMGGETLQRLVEAQNIAFADRNKFMGDGDFVDVFPDGLVNKTYARKRRSTLLPFQASAAPLPAGMPPGYPSGTRLATSPPREELGTTHFSIVDADRSLMALTTTIESNMGSGVVVPGRGFLLNNELTDFEAIDRDGDGLLYANAPEGGKRARRTALRGDDTTLGGKRPRSSMTPTLVLDRDGAPLMATGAPGGSTIISAVTNVVLRVLEELDATEGAAPSTNTHLQASTDAPRVMSQNGASATLETDFPMLPRFVAEARGFNFTTSTGIGLVQTVMIRSGLFIGACDSKRQYQGEAECGASGFDTLKKYKNKGE